MFDNLMRACGVMILGMGLGWSDVARAEDGYEAWLRYRPVQSLQTAPAAGIIVTGDGESVVIASTVRELQRGLGAMTGRPVAADAPAHNGWRIVLVTDTDSAADALKSTLAQANLPELGDEGFFIRTDEQDGAPRTVIAANSDRGILYGAFALLRQLQTGTPLDEIALRESPAIPLRMMNHWDNLDGSIERGYGGRSIFLWDELPKLNERYTDYARLLASVGINATAINNVNAGKGNNVRILSAEYLPKVAAVAEVLRQYGITLYLSVGFDAPRSLGGLETADPLDDRVQQWWNDKATEIYAIIPDFGGFLIKADSEGQPGPYRYERDHADGANLLAKALQPHGGTLIWRAFVYSLQAGGDRSAMAYDNFNPLDGRFADNAMLQIKNGPLDFQVREPVHPLFGAMPRTRQVLELQITQEYTGHHIHVCYLVRSWKQVLDFDTHMKGEGSTVARRLDGSLLDHPGAIVGVLNVGQDRNWLGHHLHMANFYGFSRLAWDPELSSGRIADEWTRLTFGKDEQVVETVVSILMDSYDAYEAYTSPLGLGVLHDPPTHLYPMPELRHYYHRAENDTVGYDRTQATGSGYTGQYTAAAGQQYESIDTCPIDLLLFFHAVPYEQELSNGKTLIQTLYDRYFDGVAKVRDFQRRWATLEGKIDDRRFAEVTQRLEQQLHHACHWRNTMTRFFFELSGVADEKKRVRSQYRLSR